MTSGGNGLTREQARERLGKNGYNELAQGKKTSRLSIFLEQFQDVLTIVLIIATVISLFLGEVSDAVTIFVILFLNGILGFVQEYKTEKSLEALSELSAPQAMVVRDGVEQKIPSREVVVGDLVILEAGDRICADCKLTECVNLQVNESILTGESVAVEKSLHTDSAVYMGTTVTAGRGRAVVEATGMATKMGQIAHMLSNTTAAVTPLKRNLNKIGKELVIICFAVCVLIFIAGLFHGQSVYDMFFSAVSLAVAAIPEGLPAVVTVALAIGVDRMLKRRALVRKLPAVETLGSTNVICTDKTGTLTENKMTVKQLYADGRLIDVSGAGYGLDGEFTYQKSKIDPSRNEAVNLLLTCGYLCNNTICRKDELIGDPTEIAIYVAAKKARINEFYLNEYQRIYEIPFDSDRKLMSVVCRGRDGAEYVFVKGAADRILSLCSRRQGDGKIVPFSDKYAVRSVNDTMTSAALRVLGFAYKQLDASYKSMTDEELESNLVFLGLEGMMDPPRKEVFAAIRDCYTAGIKPVMITGDHKNTARAIANELGFKGDNTPVTGEQLATMSDDELCDVAGRTNVFARVSPLDKLRIVRAYKRRRNVVAMTGDGVNDAPSLKEADIGISMGEGGTDVAKEASDMVLLDDNFATIVAAVEEGRMIFDNIRKFIRYLLACNLGEILMMGAAAFWGMPLPLIPIQVLWLNLVTDGLPALALGIDPPDKDIMQRQPRRGNESIFSRGLGSNIVLSGLLIGASSLVAFALSMFLFGDLQRARTVAFATLIFAELIYAFECKSEYKPIYKINLFNNLPLVGAVIGSFLLTLAVVYLPFLGNIFKTVPLVLYDWVLVAGLGLVELLFSVLVLRRGNERKYLIKYTK